MIVLSGDIEALAHRVAESRHVPVDVAIRLGLEAIGGSADPVQPAGGEALIERRRAALAKITSALAALPDLDPRTTEEIVDDINEL
jgi:hypothetical protein